MTLLEVYKCSRMDHPTNDQLRSRGRASSITFFAFKHKKRESAIYSKTKLVLYNLLTYLLADSHGGLPCGHYDEGQT